MMWMDDAERNRRENIQQPDGTDAGAATNGQGFLSTYQPQVIALLREVGLAWGGIDIDNPPPYLTPDWLDRTLRAPEPRPIKGFQVSILGGPFSSGNDVCLALGLLGSQADRLCLRYAPGYEDGGLRVSLYIDDGYLSGGLFKLVATRPHLPAVNRTCASLIELKAAIAEEWANGTFVGPFEHYIPFDNMPEE